MCVILLGYLLKRFKVLPESAFAVVSKLVLKVTLPCAVITNFAHMDIAFDLLWLLPVGFLTCALFVGIGALNGRRRGRDGQVFDMLNFTGYNIGCFSMPYVSGLLGPAAVISTCLFDAGNALWATGGTNALCAAMQNGGRLRLKPVLKRLEQSMPIWAYLSMTLLCALKLRLPEPVLQFAETVGSANTFLAMLMLGLGMDLEIRRDRLRWLGKAVLLRFGVSAVLALLFLYLLPFAYEIRLGAALSALSPCSSISPAYIGERGGDVGFASSWNTIAILLSLLFMTGLLLLTA